MTDTREQIGRRNTPLGISVEIHIDTIPKDDPFCIIWFDAAYPFSATSTSGLSLGSRPLRRNETADGS